ncbi:MAG: type I methionyl aminopeptidase [Omnitrophica WOR_2 bacterium RIFCSPHIGHO2_01_FULL_52_10]|nr:MAG: type I methionyl aminopeptidase [Omnitrophica WOR_2 bacterium RIFCSPHIGHO2_01_FULL_52_10]
MKTTNLISIKTAQEIAILRDAGKILAEIVEDLKRSLKEGITTGEVDQVAEKLIRQRGVVPAFKGYRDFPGCVCVSVNEEVVHGVPGNRLLRSGDIVSLDVGIIHKDYYSDIALTAEIGIVRDALKKLLEVTSQSLYKGIEQARVGNHLSDISHAIQTFVEANHFSIVRDFVGHGIGKNLHEDPEIPNFGPAHNGPILKEGMVFAIEPMVNMGTWQTRILDDGWTVVTQDGQPSAHFEHTVAIASQGPEIFTRI